MRIEEIHHRVPWRPGGGRPGSHRGFGVGDGFDTWGHMPLLVAQDRRRLDVRATIADPLRRVMVRTTRRISTVPVCVVGDLSASMGAPRRFRKLDVLADLVASLAWSAHRVGDPFCFVGCGDEIDKSTLLPLTHSAGAGMRVAGLLRKPHPQARGCEAMNRAHRYLPSRRSLVLLVSDFYFPPQFLRPVLGTLAQHRVVSVLLVDRSQQQTPRQSGMIAIRDSETGARRRLLVRRKQRGALAASWRQHQAAMEALFLGFGSVPVRMYDGFDGLALNRHFCG